MARKKVKLDLIASDSARKATFKKRKKGLMKKVRELSILCDIKACLLVYGPGDTTPEVWPSMPETMRILAKLQRLPELEKNKKMMNQEAFLLNRITKSQEQLKKVEKENRELEMSVLMQQCLTGRSLYDLSIENVTTLAWLTEMKLSKVREAYRARRGHEGALGKVEMGVVKVDGEMKLPVEAVFAEMQRQECWFADGVENVGHFTHTWCNDIMM